MAYLWKLVQLHGNASTKEGFFPELVTFLGITLTQSLAESKIRSHLSFEFAATRRSHWGFSAFTIPWDAAFQWRKSWSSVTNQVRENITWVQEWALQFFLHTCATSSCATGSVPPAFVSGSVHPQMQWLVQWLVSICRPFPGSSSYFPYAKGFPWGAEHDQNIYNISGVCPLFCSKDTISHFQAYISEGPEHSWAQMWQSLSL